MRRRFLIAGAGLALLWAGSFWLNLGDPTGPSAAASGQPEAFPAGKRPVTPRQLTASGSLAARPVGDFVATAHDGRSLDRAALSAGRPLVLIFIRQGCPCSVEWEPVFHRLERAYPDQARFAAVIDGDPSAARAYASANHVPHPVLADPDRALVRRFQVESGAYVALLTADGTLDRCWPGCSVDMMRELSGRLAALAGMRQRTVDFTGMPPVLTTGCPFPR